MEAETGIKQQTTGPNPAEITRLINLAERLQEDLRTSQREHDDLGTYSPSLHQQFHEHGFYRLLLPRRYGGFEVSLKDYYRVMIAIARGHPAIGWNLTLGAAHGLLVASHWPEAVQDELFDKQNYFVAPHRAFPDGRCHRVNNGFMVEGVFRYCTGITYSTHLIVNTLYSESDGAPAKSINCIIPRKNYEILDDWGGDRTLGMRASGSNSARVAATFIPERMTVPFSGFYANQDVSQGSIGTQLHKNPLYLGYLMVPYHANLVAPVIGAAKAALDEYQTILQTRPTTLCSSLRREDDNFYQQLFGQALVLTEAAEAILLQVCDQQRELGERWQRTAKPISISENVKGWGALQQAGRLACDAIELLFHTAGSSETRKDARLLRYFTDAQMYRSHTGSQWESFSAYVGRAQLGKPLDFLNL